MGRTFQPARMTPGVVPAVLWPQVTVGQTFTKGALLVLAAGKVSECAANPASVYGYAGQAAFSGYGYQSANANITTQITGQGSNISVIVADRITQHSGRMVNGGTDPVVPAITDIGVGYGVLKVGNDWVVDQSNTTQKVVKIEDIDTTLNLVYFKFLDAVLNLS